MVLLRPKLKQFKQNEKRKSRSGWSGRFWYDPHFLLQSLLNLGLGRLGTLCSAWELFLVAWLSWLPAFRNRKWVITSVTALLCRMVLSGSDWVLSNFSTISMCILRQLLMWVFTFWVGRFTPKIMFIASFRVHKAMTLLWTLLVGFILLVLEHFYFPALKTLAAIDLIVCAFAAWYMYMGIIIKRFSRKPYCLYGQENYRGKYFFKKQFGKTRDWQMIHIVDESVLPNFL